MLVSRNNEANDDAKLRGLFLTKLGPRRVEGGTKNFLLENSLFVVNPQLISGSGRKLWRIYRVAQVVTDMSWVGFTLIWMFHHVAQLPSQFCPSRMGQIVA